MEEKLSGAVAGLAGTVVMSTALGVAKAIGMLPGEVPPRKVARHVEEALELHDGVPSPAFEARWIGQHFAYGAAGGVAYALIQRRLRLGEPLPAGPLFGAALWACSYIGWLPAAGLYPSPTADRNRRIATMITVHLIYGTATAAALRFLRSANPACTPS